MTKRKNKIILVAVLLAVAFASFAAGYGVQRISKADITVEETAAPEEAIQLSLWNEGESKASLQAYVEAVCKTDGEDYIPVEDRIAVFDMDGTLIGEHFPIYFDWIMYCDRVLDDENYQPTKEQIEVARDIVEAARALSQNTGGIPDHVEEAHYLANGEVYSGMSVEEFKAYVQNFLQKPADCYEGLTFQDAYFRPMKEVVEYLQENDFTVYVVSGTDRDAVRVFASEFLDLPSRQIIGSDFYTVGSKQNDKDYLEHQFGSEEEVLRSDKPIIKNVKMSKVMQIAQEIGQQPVLAFGNSSGDYSMFTYTTSNNPYRAEAFCLVPDDDTREYEYAEKAEKLKQTCAENGWHAVSMKDDFKQIYGSEVNKNLNHTPWLDRMEELLQ